VFPLVIGSLRFDLTVVRKPPACRADERPLMWALVGRVTAAPVGRGTISGRRVESGQAGPLAVMQGVFAGHVRCRSLLTAGPDGAW
jgi:hypothetical protein